MSVLTVIFPVKNEAEYLSRAIPLATELGSVVVVDSSSTDETISISEKLGAEVVQFEWNGCFPKKRNWALRNYEFKPEWVLFLDADEFVSEPFIEEVQSAIRSTDCVGYWLNFDNYFMGQLLRHGDPMRKLALFRVGAGEYERIDEEGWSHLDMEVHEHPVLNGPVGKIESPVEHNDYRGLKHYIAKHNEYATWEASRYVRLKVGSPEWNGLTARQKKKYTHIAKWWFAPAYFCITYFLKKGILDGSAGFHFALMKAHYFYQIRLKIKEASTVN